MQRNGWYISCLIVSLGLIDHGSGLTPCSQFQKIIDGELIVCSGHGICTSQTKACHCEDGYGSIDDLAKKLVHPYPKPDCSERVCPLGKAWEDIPTGVNTAHAQIECSNVGICDREIGACICPDQYAGAACQFTSCRKTPNEEECSGHGVCMTLKELAVEASAQPISSCSSYGGSSTSVTWDEDMIRACLCDSRWSVGLGSGEMQLPEYYGPYCEYRRCPSADDPVTDDDETDCSGKIQDDLGKVTASGSGGQVGNKCYVACANRGVCDADTGSCQCFPGFKGEYCTVFDPS